jgi:hypothetical protein
MTTTKDKTDQGKPSKLVTIYVNTISHQVEKDELSFDDVVKLAFPTPPAGSDGFTVLYQRGHGNKDGSLVEGDTIKVKDGMIFDVTPTHLS